MLIIHNISDIHKNHPHKEQLMKNRLTALFITLILILSALPVTAFASTTVEPASAVQIGNYFQVDDANGTISGSEAPNLAAGSTQQSYADGHVKVNKTIQGTQTENVFEITLEVVIDESVIFDVQERSGDAAVVLVVDMSGSMLNNYNTKYGTRIQAANAAISAFLTKYKQDMGTSTRKIAVVGFGGSKNSNKDGAWTHLGWTDVNANTAINTLNATSNTGTNLEAGIILAKNLLSQKLYNGKNEEITNKSIILLSDGQPTYHVNDTWERQSTSLSVICEDGRHIGGSGNTTTCNEHKPVETLMKDSFFTNINKYAVYIAGNNDKLNCQSRNCALNSNIGIQSWLGNVCDFNTILADGAGNLDLSTVFEDIATHITLEGTPGLVTDPMGQNVDLHAVGSTKVEDFVLNTNNPVNVEDNILGWNLKKASYTTSGTNDEIKTYTLTYDATLDTLDPNFEKGVFFPTNGVTDLPYGIKNATTGKLESVGVAFFNLPSVQGYTGSFSFNKVDESGAPLAGATFKLEHTEMQGIMHHTHEWVATATSDSSGVVTFSNIPSGHHYKLTEVSAPNGYTKSSDEYEVIVSYGNVTVTDKNGVQVYPVAAGSTSNTFSISNTKDATGITVKKVWSDNGYAGVTHPTSVQVQLYADGVVSGNPVTLSEDTADPSKNWTYTWSNLRKTNDNGEAILYKVEETSDHNDYTVSYSDITDGVITITNKYDPTHGKLKLTKTFAGKVTSAPAGFDAEFVVTGPDNYSRTINWSEFEGGHYVIEGLNPGTYFVTETINGTPAAYTVATTYIGSGEVEAGETAEVTVTNTYSDNPETIDITVNKVWAGEDTTNRRPSEVRVELTSGAFGSAATLSESNGWSYTFEDLPKYANGKEVVYGVNEISIVSRYTPSYGSITPVDGSTNAYSITVTNTYQGVEFSVPVYKVVNGDNAPAENFEFDVAINKLRVDPTPEQYVSYGGAVVTAQGANGTVASYADGKLSIQTNGKGEYLAWLYFVVPKDEAGKFAVSISEKDGGAAGWTYDGSEWLVTVDCSGSTPTYTSQKAGPVVINEAAVQPPTFTNSYAKPTAPTPTPRPHRPSADPTPYPIDFIPKSGDMSLIGYGVMAVIAAAGAMGYKKKK